MASSIIKTEIPVTRQRSLVLVFAFCLLPFALSPPAAAQRVAVLAPDDLGSSKSFGEKLIARLGERIKVLDSSLSEAAYSSTSTATPFNLTVEDSKKIGAAIGCDFLILLRSATLRRSAFQRAEYYESYAAIFIVSARSGRLVLWKLSRFEAERPATAEKMLGDSVSSIAAEIETVTGRVAKAELTEPALPVMEEVPEASSPAAKNFRAPIPFRRIKPDYTAEAALYDISATVDLIVDTDATGTVLRTEVVRWAGFELDESVVKTVRSMNWRPAERNGKPLPMRFLVRYNFKKVEKD